VTPSTATPKTPKTPNTPNTPTPVRDYSRLPQTGQLWWPVPVLALVGAAFVLVGWFRRRSN
jgi:LPXTG-motif cell wall-anchored protein